jgi:hypothetical protein
MELLSDSVERVGYLPKDRVSDVNEFRSSVRRVAEGGSAIDPAVVAQLVGKHRDQDPLAGLTPREREVLERSRSTSATSSKTCGSIAAPRTTAACSPCSRSCARPERRRLRGRSPGDQQRV